MAGGGRIDHFALLNCWTLITDSVGSPNGTQFNVVVACLVVLAFCCGFPARCLDLSMIFLVTTAARQAATLPAASAPSLATLQVALAHTDGHNGKEEHLRHGQYHHHGHRPGAIGFVGIVWPKIESSIFTSSYK